MAGKFSVQIEGVNELRTGFSDLSDQMQRSALRAALRVAASVVVKEAKMLAPVQTGALRKSIRAEIKVNRNRAEATIGFGKDQYYGQFMELGTSKMAARPFLRPALDMKQGETIAKFASAIQQIVEKMRARMARKA